MSIISVTFAVFALGVFVLYYLIPSRYQWILLLVASGVFYISGGIRSAGYVVITATTIYLAAAAMQKLSEKQKKYLRENKESLSREEKKAFKARIKTRRRMWMLAALLLNIGILCFFKYFHFVLAQINAVLSLTGAGRIEDAFTFIIPLGISFYTFQAVGYLLNVYWEKLDAQQNYFRFLLFVTFFPQITQGPISEYDQLSQQLFSAHELVYDNVRYGLQRMIWGYFKKMVIADNLSVYVSAVFQNYQDFSGITTLIGAFFYSVQIYADFSGYMDIMCGFCQILDIHLTENFNLPYFSRSVAEYWRRWHISLGAWFKNYVYFPIGMSSWSRKLGRATRERFGKHFADTFPATIALLIVWTATGLWHGASWAYIAWGLVNGIFIIFGMWMEPVYEKWRKALHLHEKNRLWIGFQMVRTFVLVTFIKVLPEVGTLADGIGLWKHIFTSHMVPASLHQLFPFVTQYTTFGFVVIGMILLFVCDVIQFRRPVREVFDRVPPLLQDMILAVFIMLIIALGSVGANGGGFMYAQF